jgi:hypothetical protein
MTYFALDDLIDRFKRIVLWIIVKVMFFSSELREEATLQCNSKVIQIPGVFYGLNLIRGYQAIGHRFPARCKAVRTDYILGYVKLTLVIACAGVLLFLLWKHTH